MDEDETPKKKQVSTLKSTNTSMNSVLDKLERVDLSVLSPEAVIKAQYFIIQYLKVIFLFPYLLEIIQGMYLTLIIFLLFSPWLNRKIFLQLWKKLWKLLVITIQHLVIMNMIMIKIIWNRQTLQYLIASHHVPGTTGQSGLNICILISIQL